MPSALRQRSLFVAEDWRVIYRAFTNVSFSSYDFDTIRNSMIDYIRINFPEDFNDWIESSEFVAIIELLAYLGQSLAFRMDLNTRENFLDTAERRESILRLSRMLSYSPSRNRTAVGLVKITQISTSQSLIDSNGNNLANRTVRWNDANNPDWFEQFILILNSLFNSTNPFGNPTKDGTVSNIRTQLYTLNNDPAANKVFPFTALINNESLNFEIVNPDFNDGEFFFEREPDPLEPLHIIYRNDGEGNASPNTGFFLMFKQGTLKKEDFRIDIPIENRILNVDGTGINNTDVFVHEINEDGFIIDKWNKVPAVVGNNIIFNSLERNARNIYSVITRANDSISIRFADGRFGNVPTGFFRVWYRESAGIRYTINPEDMRNIRLDIPYFDGVSNNLHFATLTFSLQSSVSNSAPSQSSAEIRQVAPQVYYTQDRMVNGEDYNVFPLRNPEAVRIKAVNRIYSGFSRHIDINDPTGRSQTVNLFAEDGLLYFEINNSLEELALPSNLTDDEITRQVILPMMQHLSRRHFFYFFYPRFETAEAGVYNPDNPLTHVFWINATNAVNSSTGRLFVDPIGVGSDVDDPAFGVNATPIKVGNAVLSSSPEYQISEGALIKFKNAGWVQIVSITGDGDSILTNGDGAIRLAESVENGDYIEKIIPAFRTELTNTEETIITSQIVQKNSFGLRYDIVSRGWKLITGDNLNVNGNFSLDNAGNNSGQNLDASWLIRAEYSPSNWRFTSRGLDYIFESDNQIRFFFSSNMNIVDPQTGRVDRDFVKVLKVNPSYDVVQNLTNVDFSESTNGFESDFVWNIESVFTENDGFIDPRRVKVTFPDSDQDGIADDPTYFEVITKINESNLSLDLPDGVVDETELFWEAFINTDGFQEFRPTTKISKAYNNQPNPFVPSSIPEINDGEVIYIRKNDDGNLEPQFYQAAIDTDTFQDVSDFYYTRRGRKNLYFQWKHYAPVQNRIDPAISNIIDTFVLTRQYDIQIRQWIDDDGERDEKPTPPTSEELRSLFAEEIKTKMISDEIIWHPVKYKLLFGRQAPDELQARFKVTKVPGTSVSDGEIKARVINAINEFFAINNFDFGETFYFTELAAFIHQRLATIIGSIVLVPLDDEQKFGNLFQVRSAPDEVFISAAKVSDIQIVNAFNNNNLRIGN